MPQCARSALLGRAHGTGSTGIINSRLEEFPALSAKRPRPTAREALGQADGWPSSGRTSAGHAPLVAENRSRDRIDTSTGPAPNKPLSSSAPATAGRPLAPRFPFRAVLMPGVIAGQPFRLARKSHPARSAAAVTEGRSEAQDREALTAAGECALPDAGDPPGAAAPVGERSGDGRIDRGFEPARRRAVSPSRGRGGGAPRQPNVGHGRLAHHL